eukprot:TRINITY_DN1853_c0_g1_i1.p1 TRINITY_DN1853_c0_g1~~TRINITY_DN1853_c0_g1_i1.p1  ORF type:complete len:327 (+),score=86.59 TRINITY_DN1853_c0_g1_i1:90-983(+)
MARLLATVLVLLVVFKVAQTLQITELAEYVKEHKEDYKAGSVIEVEGYPKLVVKSRTGDNIVLHEDCGGSGSVFQITGGVGVIDELSGRKGCSGSQQAAVYHQFGIGWGVREFTLIDLADLPCALGVKNPDENHHGTAKIWIMLSGDGSKWGTYAGKSFAVNYGGREYPYKPPGNLEALRTKVAALRGLPLNEDIKAWLKKATGSGCGSLVDTIISQVPLPATLSGFAKALADYAGTEGVNKADYCNVYYQFLKLFTGQFIRVGYAKGRPAVPGSVPLINLTGWAANLSKRKRRRFK